MFLQNSVSSTSSSSCTFLKTRPASIGVWRHYIPPYPSLVVSFLHISLGVKWFLPCAVILRYLSNTSRARDRSSRKSLTSPLWTRWSCCGLFMLLEGWHLCFRLNFVWSQRSTSILLFFFLWVSRPGLMSYSLLCFWFHLHMPSSTPYFLWLLHNPMSLNLWATEDVRLQPLQYIHNHLGSLVFCLSMLIFAGFFALWSYLEFLRRLQYM